MKLKDIDLLKQNIGFHDNLQRNAVSIRKLNSALGSGKSLYADLLPPVFIEEKDGKLLLVCRHWSYDIAYAQAVMQDKEIKTHVIIADKKDMEQILKYDTMEIAMLTKIKTSRDDTTKGPDSASPDEPDTSI